MNFLQQTYTGFVYASDEDFEARTHSMQKLRETQPPSASAGKPTPVGEATSPPKTAGRPMLDFVCSLDWELKYHDIFVKYADSLVDAIYEDDQHVENDVELQDFYKCLNTLFETVPDRYNAFRSKAGIKRFLSDTINHLVVGHEFYGTTGVSGAADPRVIMVSVRYNCRDERIDPKIESMCMSNTRGISCYWHFTDTSSQGWGSDRGGRMAVSCICHFGHRLCGFLPSLAGSRKRPSR
jgi:hypothetical protein